MSDTPLSATPPGAESDGPPLVVRNPALERRPMRPRRPAWLLAIPLVVLAGFAAAIWAIVNHENPRSRNPSIQAQAQVAAAQPLAPRPALPPVALPSITPGPALAQNTGAIRTAAAPRPVGQPATSRARNAMTRGVNASARTSYRGPEESAAASPAPATSGPTSVNPAPAYTPPVTPAPTIIAPNAAASGINSNSTTSPAPSPSAPSSASSPPTAAPSAPAMTAPSVAPPAAATPPG